MQDHRFRSAIDQSAVNGAVNRLIGPNGRARTKVSDTKVRFKRFSREDIETYLRTGEWRGKAGGYAIQGRAEAFVRMLQGSYSGVVGLPLYETLALLQGAGFPVYQAWMNQGEL